MNDRLVEKLVSHRFPGYGKEAWTGRVIDGPDEHDRYEIEWGLEGIYTKHKGSVVMKWLVEPMSKNVAAKVNGKPIKTKHGFRVTRRKASKHCAVASIERSRGCVTETRAACNKCRIPNGVDSAELAITSKFTTSDSVKAVVDTMTKSRATVAAEGAANQVLKVSGEEAANPVRKRDCPNQQQSAVVHVQGENGGSDAPPFAAQRIYGDTGDFGESPLAANPSPPNVGGCDVSPAVVHVQGETGGSDGPAFAAERIYGDTGDFGDSPLAANLSLWNVGCCDASPAIVHVPVETGGSDGAPFATERMYGDTGGFGESPLAAKPSLPKVGGFDISPAVVHALSERGGSDGAPLAAQSIYGDIGDFGESPLAANPSLPNVDGFDVSPFALYGDTGGLDKSPVAAQGLNAQAGGFDEAPCIVKTLREPRDSLDDSPFAVHMLNGEIESHDAAAANTTTEQRQDFTMAGTAFLETTAHAKTKVKRGWAEAFKESKEKHETTHLRTVASHSVCNAPHLKARADSCMFSERTTLTDADGPSGHGLLCTVDEMHNAHLACAGHESLLSNVWYCPLRADEKGDAATQLCKEEEASVVQQRASPSRALAISSRVKALVKHLQESFFAAICGSLPHDDAAAMQLLMSDRFAYQLYAKAIFWAGAEGMTSPYPSRRVVNRVSAEVAALIKRNEFPNELPCNGNVAFIAQAIAMRWLEECERTAGRPLTVTEPDVGEPELLKTLVACGEQKEVPLPSSDCLVPYPTECIVAPSLIDVLELSPANDAGNAVRVRQDVFARLCERFNAWLDSQELGFSKTLDEEDNNLHQAQRDAATSASAAGVLPTKSGILRRNRDCTRQQRPNERKLRRDGELVRRVYVMLLRHGSLVRGDLGQHDMIPNTVMTILRKWGCQCECFATPFSARMSAFCSPFADCDACFGSLGNFFDFWPLEGSFQANPPFFINNDTVLDHLAELLRRAQTGCKPLSFALVHTEAHHLVCKQHSVFNSFIRAELLLEKDRHYYEEGAYFCRAQPRAYLPPFRSYVVFAATLEGTRKWPVTPDLLNAIEGAFAWPPREARMKMKPAKEPPATCSL